MKRQSLIGLAITLAVGLSLVSLSPAASTSLPQQWTSISFTVTTTTNYPMTTGGNLQVAFNSIQLTTPPPVAYSFGVTAKTFPGLWITNLIWQFGDGSSLNVPYCCQSWISEVQSHAYKHAGSYTVLVIALDNAGNFGNALVTVNWVTPIPEYPAYITPLIASVLLALIGAAWIRKGLRQGSVTIFAQ